jgi:cardiolipin synthase
VSDWFKPTDYWLLPEITAHLGFLLALIFLAHLIRQKRSPASTLAWLLLILFLPYVGVPLYLVFGGRKMIRMARRKAQVYDRSHLQARGQADSDVEQILLSYGVPPARAGNHVELVTRGEEAFRDFLRIVESARSTIHITTYILGRGEVGRELVLLLRGKLAGAGLPRC